MCLSVLFSGILMLASPLLATPFVLYNIYMKRRGAIFLFAFLIGIFAFLTPPWEDLYRHTISYYEARLLDFSAFWSSLDDDFLVQIISYLLSVNDINFSYARFFYLFFQICILGYILSDLERSKNLNRSQEFVLFLIVFCGFNIIESILGVRHGFALVVFCLGIYLLYYKNRMIESIMILLVSSFIHFFYLPLLLCALIVYFCPIKISQKMFYMLAVFSVICGYFLSSTFILSYYSDKMYYLEGHWGTDFETNWRGQIFYGMKRIWIIPLFLFFLKKGNDNGKYRCLIYVFILIFLSTFSLAVISGRIIGVISIMLIIYYIDNIRNSSKRIFTAIAISAILFLCSNVYGNRIIFTHSFYSDVWKPVPFIFHDNYTLSWIFEHVNRDGSFK